MIAVDVSHLYMLSRAGLVTPASIRDRRSGRKSTNYGRAVTAPCGHSWHMTRERLALGALVAQLIAVLWLAPASVLHSPGEPTSLATFATFVVTLFLLASRLARTD